MKLIAAVLTILVLNLLCAKPPANAASDWPDYQIIEWQPRSAQQLLTLKGIGVTGGAAFINREAGTFDPGGPVVSALRDSGMRYFIENIATDFYAPYHRFTPGRRPNWRFKELQARYQAEPDDASVFLRDPGLSDPVWLNRIADRLKSIVEAAKPDHPLYYTLGDETGIADLAANWDFDLSTESLAGFRSWLQTQYSSLDALNAEWGTNYTSWDQVMPELTRTAMRRGDDNFAAWSDFKAWMDVAFARALRAGADAVHSADPTARSAIEGAQVPGWGGYDYTLLAHTVDVMEIYDTYENLPILRSFNPPVVPLITAFGSSPQQLHAIWREWLRGCRGLVLWDDKSRIVSADGALGADGQGYAPVFAALRGRIGRAVLDAEPVFDPVAVLYSPPSFRVSWILEHRPRGDAWITRTAAQEDTGNAHRESLAAYAQELAHVGLTPRYISPEQLARTELNGAKALILPHAVALSSAEAEALRKFAAAGGLIIADVPPGDFDAHGRRLRQPAQVPATKVPPENRPALTAALAAARIGPRFPVQAPAGDVTTYVFSNGSQIIVALHRDFAESGGPEQIVLHLPQGFSARDLQTEIDQGSVQTLSLTLDAVTPAIIALIPDR
jgi:hypothetical protein